MKKQLLKKLPAFIITILMFSVATETVNAQRKKKPPIICNCLIRPIPFACGQICSFRLMPIIKIPSNDEPQENTLYFNSPAMMLAQLLPVTDEYPTQLFEGNEPLVMLSASLISNGGMQQKMDQLLWGITESPNAFEIKQSAGVELTPSEKQTN